MSTEWDRLPDGRRLYGRNAANAGHPEDVTRCIESVCGEGLYGSFCPHQCKRKRGKGKDGLYCGIHAKRHPAD